MRRLTVLTVALSASLLARGVDLPYAEQRVRLYAGWNLFHLSVTPREDADEIFGKFPVLKGVAMYDAESFLRTQQASVQGQSEGLSDPAVKMWFRNDPDASQFSRLRANTVYICEVTNDFETLIWGRPEAARLVWHRADTNLVMNYIGPSLDPELESVDIAAYFAGCTAGIGRIYRVSGYGPAGMEYEYVSGPVRGRDGEAFAISANRTSLWSGPFYVEPQRGAVLTFEAPQVKLSVRNDSDRNRTVVIAFRNAPTPSGARLHPGSAFRIRENAEVGTEVTWTDFNESTEIRREILPGSNVEWIVTADIGALTGDAGGVVSFSDPDGTRMRTSIPLAAEYAPYRAERGLWIVNAELDASTWAQHPTNLVADVPAGGRMKVRLPMYVDAQGQMTLLQRVDFRAGADGKLRAYSGTAFGDSVTSPDDRKGMFKRRISSTVLPFEACEVPCESNARFGERAAFRFAVDYLARTNPMRHAHHPDHDGMTSDYSGVLPSGDDFNGYVGKVKPELFGVRNTINFDWDAMPQDGTSDDARSGTLRWTFEGLHRYGPLVASGRFAMRKIMSERVFLGSDGDLGEEDDK